MDDPDLEPLYACPRCACTMAEDRSGGLCDDCLESAACELDEDPMNPEDLLH